MNQDLPVLHQFPYSHFNEKARWGLDWKGVRHRRRSHLPGPHALAIRRLSGQTATPVLYLEGRVVAGSHRILEALEAWRPEPRLFPPDPGERARALEIARHFDAVVGPAVRTVVFSVLIEEPDYLCGMFSEGQRPWLRSLYRASFPLVRGLMARANGTHDPAGVKRAFELTESALDQVARAGGAGAPLVGGAFGVADLTCAALLAVVTSPEHPDMARPRPYPEAFERLLERWEDHPGVAWVRAQYARHRPPSCEAAVD